VLLAAACPARRSQHVLELGCGVGTAALCLATRVPGLALTGVERQSDAAGLARRNAAAAGIEMEVITADIAALPDALRRRGFDHVIANPPYFRRDSSKPGPDPSKEAARGEQTPLDLWCDVASRRLAPGGWLTMIHRPERLDALLAGLSQLGSIQIQPLLPREGRDASLVLVRARKGGRGSLRLHAPVVLHAGRRHVQDGDDYAAPISAVLREGAALPGFGQPPADEKTR
jgi:tRNA1(Val) A37 N6-methylase TrmN6